MYPQHQLMMNVKEEEMRRDIERRMRLKQARAAARNGERGALAELRRVFGQALIAAGGRIQPSVQPASDCDASVELELAR